ncbi:MAG: DUF805 domain-containing protein [Alphaproteobacteria bacterium]|nr:DUF805 domain-containing protein [Alphaproteobacteria bacterium]
MADQQTPERSNQTHNVLWAMLKFSGRMNREEYWWANAFLLGISLVAFRMLFAGSIELSSDGEILLPDALMAPFFMIMIASLYVTFAISVKRLHDLGWPGIVACVFLFPAIGLLAFLLLGLLKGNNEPNKYGMVPPR